MFLTSDKLAASLEDDSFENEVNLAMQRRLSDVLRNKSLKHAKSVILALLGVALRDELSVKIVSGRLNPICFDFEVENKISLCLSRNIEVSVIVADLSAEEALRNGIVRKVVSSSSGMVFLPKASSRQSLFAHFAVVGAEAFRYEVEKEKAEAYFSFNRPEIAGILVRHFDALSESCERLVYENA